ncbi:MAG: hypothetical protein SH819_09860 [Cytophagales bacterium]|nr:hypothetical protein [Cytophagales bacterium]
MKETEAYLGVDQKTWFSTWMPVTYAYWSFSDSTGTQFIDGWENIQKTFDAYFKTQRPSRSRVTHQWQDIRVYQNGAYIRFRQREDNNNRVIETSQIRVLEKKDGQWKLVCMSAVVD